MKKDVPPGQEVYSPGYGEEIVRSFRRRRAGIEAAFFVPHLRSGMRLLDCGCGPGGIALGFAPLVDPGTVTGVDLEPRQAALARAGAKSSGVDNVHFSAASAYSLPFPDESFDAVFANALLQHLGDPDLAVREMYRVLKWEGVVGIRDDDQGSLILAPPDPRLHRVVAVIKGIMRHTGGNPEVGRSHRQLLQQAGFANVEGSASVEWDGDAESTRRRGDLGASLLERMSATAVEAGLAMEGEMASLAEVCRQWGRRPDAFDVITWCEAWGHKR